MTASIPSLLTTAEASLIALTIDDNTSRKVAKDALRAIRQVRRDIAAHVTRIARRVGLGTTSFSILIEAPETRDEEREDLSCLHFLNTVTDEAFDKIPDDLRSELIRELLIETPVLP